MEKEADVIMLASSNIPAGKQMIPPNTHNILFCQQTPLYGNIGIQLYQDDIEIQSLYDNTVSQSPLDPQLNG